MDVNSRLWRPDTGLEMGVVLGMAPSTARTIRCVTREGWADTAAGLDENTRAWFDVQGFEAASGTSAYAQNSDGGPGDIWLGVSQPAIASEFAALATRLPAGDYRLNALPDAAQAALGWALGLYKFDARRVEGAVEPSVRLHVQASADLTSAIQKAAAIRLSRDLVNSPAQDLGKL